MEYVFVFMFLVSLALNAYFILKCSGQDSPSFDKCTSVTLRQAEREHLSETERLYVLNAELQNLDLKACNKLTLYLFKDNLKKKFEL